MSDRPSYYRKVLDKNLIKSDLLREFINRELWSPAIVSINQQLHMMDKQRAALLKMRREIGNETVSKSVPENS